MTTAKKKPFKKAPVRAPKKITAGRKVAPAKPRYSEQYERALKDYERGVSLIQKRSFAEALEILREVLEKFPEEGEICDRTRQYIAICQERINVNVPRPQTAADHFHLGVYHLNRAETAAAIKQFEKALEQNPQGDMVHYAIASAYAQSGDRARAVSALQEAIRLNDKNRVYAQNDPDFDRIRDEHEFIQLVEPEEVRAR